MGFSICFFLLRGDGGDHFAILCHGCLDSFFLLAMALCVGGAQNISNYFHFFLLLKVGSCCRFSYCIRLLVLLLSDRGAGVGSFVEAARCLRKSNLNSLEKSEIKRLTISLPIYFKNQFNTSWAGSSRMERITGAGISAGSSGIITAWTSGEAAAADS